MGKKTWLVFSCEREDEEPVLYRMTRDELLSLSKSANPGDFAVVDGNLLKSFDQKLDIGRLK
jgi:hypothetical protein